MHGVHTKVTTSCYVYLNMVTLNIHSKLVPMNMYHDQSLLCCLCGLHWATIEAESDRSVLIALAEIVISQFLVCSITLA